MAALYCPSGSGCSEASLAVASLPPFWGRSKVPARGQELREGGCPPVPGPACRAPCPGPRPVLTWVTASPVWPGSLQEASVRPPPASPPGCQEPPLWGPSSQRPPRPAEGSGATDVQVLAGSSALGAVSSPARHSPSTLLDGTTFRATSWGDGCFPPPNADPLGGWTGAVGEGPVSEPVLPRGLCVALSARTDGWTSAPR